MFALSGEEATQDPSLIQGKCLIRYHSLIMLYDAGATHSFISNLCINMLDLPVSKLPYELLVSTPTDSKVLTSTASLDCPITFDIICL